MTDDDELFVNQDEVEGTASGVWSRMLAGNRRFAEGKPEHPNRGVEAREAARIARLDSLERVRAYRADSAAVMDSLQQGKERLLGPARFGGLAVADLPSRYYIIVGAFSVWDNASRFCQQMTDKGYPAEIIAFRNGYHAVGVCRTDDVVEIYRSLKELKRQPFCPANIWILSKD